MAHGHLSNGVKPEALFGARDLVSRIIMELLVLLQESAKRLVELDQ